MRLAVADDALMWLDQRSQREAICRRASCYPQHSDFMVKCFGERRIEPLAPRIAIISGIDLIGIGYRLHHLGMHRCRIVGEKTHERRLMQNADGRQAIMRENGAGSRE